MLMIRTPITRRKSARLSSLLLAAASTAVVMGFTAGANAQDLREPVATSENSVSSAFDKLVATAQAQMMKAPSDAYAAALGAEELATALPVEERAVAHLALGCERRIRD